MRAIVDAHVQATSSELRHRRTAEFNRQQVTELRSSGTTNLLPTTYDARVPGCAVLPEESWNKSNAIENCFAV